MVKNVFRDAINKTNGRTMYQVVAGNRTTEFELRREAILEARQVSQRFRREVFVLRTDGRERMVYRRGRLESGALGKPRRARMWR